MIKTLLIERPRCPGKTTTRQVPELRACALCMHSAGHQPGSSLVCRAPAVVAIHGNARPIGIVRSTYGTCGPDARHLDMRSWQQHRSRGN